MTRHAVRIARSALLLSGVAAATGCSGDDGGGLDATSNSITATDGPGRSDPESVAPDAPQVSVITWRDSRGAAREMQLYGYLYQYDFSFVGGESDASQETTVSANDDAYGHAGFGYVVSHNSETGNSPIGKENEPTRVETTVFAGAHHAIHHIELTYDRDKEGGGQGIAIPVVIEWFVATGRDHPVWSVTWKMGSVANPEGVDLDTYRMDSRGPYGSLNFDGATTPDDGDAIGGVAWGDFARAFTTTDAMLTLDSPWTYDAENDVAFTQTWTATTNAEMGIVETQLADKEMGYPDRVVGRERGSTSDDGYLDKRDCADFGEDARDYAMPCAAGWPYQLMNFDWDPTSGKPVDEATGTKLIAWGTPYGWLGSSSFDLFDYSATADGRGDRAYATMIALGPRCRFDGGTCDASGGAVNTAIRDVEAIAGATMTATVGTLVSEIPRGPGASDTKPIANGYDDRYAVHAVVAASNHASFTLTPADGRPIANPIFVVQGYTGDAAPTVQVDGTSRSVNTGDADSGAFVSLDVERDELWVTLNQTLTAATVIEIQ